MECSLPLPRARNEDAQVSTPLSTREIAEAIVESEEQEAARDLLVGRVREVRRLEALLAEAERQLEELSARSDAELALLAASAKGGKFLQATNWSVRVSGLGH
jgi:hypothetical protein